MSDLTNLSSSGGSSGQEARSPLPQELSLQLPEIGDPSKEFEKQLEELDQQIAEVRKTLEQLQEIGGFLLSYFEHQEKSLLAQRDHLLKEGPSAVWGHKVKVALDAVAEQQPQLSLEIQETVPRLVALYQNLKPHYDSLKASNARETASRQAAAHETIVRETIVPDTPNLDSFSAPKDEVEPAPARDYLLDSPTIPPSVLQMAPPDLTLSQQHTQEKAPQSEDQDNHSRSRSDELKNRVQAQNRALQFYLQTHNLQSEYGVEPKQPTQSVNQSPQNGVEPFRAAAQRYRDYIGSQSANQTAPNGITQNGIDSGTDDTTNHVQPTSQSPDTIPIPPRDPRRKLRDLRQTETDQLENSSNQQITPSTAESNPLSLEEQRKEQRKERRNNRQKRPINDRIPSLIKEGSESSQPSSPRQDPSQSTKFQTSIPPDADPSLVPAPLKPRPRRIRFFDKIVHPEPIQQPQDTANHVPQDQRPVSPSLPAPRRTPPPIPQEAANHAQPDHQPVGQYSFFPRITALSPSDAARFANREPDISEPIQINSAPSDHHLPSSPALEIAYKLPGKGGFSPNSSEIGLNRYFSKLSIPDWCLHALHAIQDKLNDASQTFDQATNRARKSVERTFAVLPIHIGVSEKAAGKRVDRNNTAQAEQPTQKPLSQKETRTAEKRLAEKRLIEKHEKRLTKARDRQAMDPSYSHWGAIINQRVYLSKADRKLIEESEQAAQREAQQQVDLGRSQPSTSRRR
jgi:hypothetical protein